MSAALKYWTIERDSAVILARFANPPMGYFCAVAAQELAGLIDEWDDASIRAVVLTGHEGRFITHYSVEELIAFGADQSAMEAIGTALSDGYHALLKRLAALSKPVIAAIDGDCMGGGLELAMWCDLRILGDGKHRLGLPEIRLGIMPGGSGTQRLRSLVGEAKAREMILMGNIITPSEALRVGIVNRVVRYPVDEAMAIARDLARLNPRAIANIKHAMVVNEDEGLRREAACFLDTMRAPVAVETMREYVKLPNAKRRGYLEQE